MADTAAAAEVRTACELTIGLGNARISYELDVESRAIARLVDFIAGTNVTPPPSKTASTVWSLIGRGAKLVEQGVASLASGRREGVADFRAGVCLVSRHGLGIENESLYLPGRMLDRYRGSWHQKTGHPFVGHMAYSPIWLVELVRGATEAQLVGQDAIAGDEWRHFRGRADRRDASRRSQYGISLRIGRRPADSPATFEAWIDADGRLRRVRCTPNLPAPDAASEPLASGVFDVTLTDLGTAPAPEPPAEYKIRTGELLASKHAEPVVRSWVQRLPQILPPDIAVSYEHGLIFTLTHQATRRTSSVQLQMATLLLPGTGTEKLQRAYSTHGEDVQQLLSEMSGKDWPGPDSRTRVTVAVDHIRVEWSSTGRQTIALPTIPRSEIGL